ncbi:Disease resistance protein [Nymphaea thermarum]|nr:Disease resistance protein [Nymphaea thermarum]
MHDQLRDMGRWIVRECHPYEPNLHSRLWLHEEGTAIIEGISLDLEGLFPDIENFKCEVFRKLPNLRLLRANFARFKGYEHMPKELRWLEWHGCPLRSLPDYVTLDKVAVLDLSKSKIERLWQTKWWWWSRKKVLASLRVLHLSDCLHLKTTPDFSTMPLLEKLSLDGCENLREVHESIGDLQRLVVLNMSSCSKLIRLPDSFCRLSSLEELSLMHLRVKLLPSKIGLLKNLHRLYLYGCSDLEELPDSIGNMTKLEELDLNGCERLGTLPASVGNMEDLMELDLNGCGIESLPSSISSLKKLKELKLWCCRQLSSLPDSVQSMTWLEKLDVRSCSKLTSLPDCIGRIENLVELNFDGQNMKELPDSIVSLENMKKLRLYWCSMLERLPDQIGRMTKLEKLDLRFCKSLRTLPDSIGNMTNLVELDISFTGIEHLPSSIVYLEKLTTLRMLRCTKPRGLPLGRMKGLQHLLVMGNGEKEFKHEPYYEVSEKISQKSGYCQQTKEFRMIQFTGCKEEHSVWEVQWKLFIRLDNQEKVIQVEETHMKDWGWNRGMQWLGLLFPEDFVLDDEPNVGLLLEPIACVCSSDTGSSDYVGVGQMEITRDGIWVSGVERPGWPLTEVDRNTQNLQGHPLTLNRSPSFSTQDQAPPVTYKWVSSSTYEQRALPTYDWPTLELAVVVSDRLEKRKSAALSLSIGETKPTADNEGTTTAPPVVHEQKHG